LVLILHVFTETNIEDLAVKMRASGGVRGGDKAVVSSVLASESVAIIRRGISLTPRGLITPRSPRHFIFSDVRSGLQKVSIEDNSTKGKEEQEEGEGSSIGTGDHKDSSNPKGSTSGGSAELRVPAITPKHKRGPSAQYHLSVTNPLAPVMEGEG
jgi:hypothetical protein